MSSNLRVLIVGASIAGPTAAYWFARLRARVTVVERFPALRTNGQGIDIRTVGVTVMRRMPGMEAAVLAKKSALEDISFLGPDGRPVATFRATGDPDQRLAQKRRLRLASVLMGQGAICFANKGGQGRQKKKKKKKKVGESKRRAEHHRKQPNSTSPTTTKVWSRRKWATRTSRLS
ncbi:hypothetical protein DFJ73DRAFT_254201 [Zopfochytrium polystomum]|nr:hypothetical protein DFJ73DRAFT_254201 [Zopfochytrium polystomum]